MTAPSCIKRGVRGAKPGVPHKKRQRPNTDTATPSVTLASTQSAETSASASPINSRSSHYLQPLAPGHNPISSAASVILRLEYCNSVLAGAPLSITAPLQTSTERRGAYDFELQLTDNVTPCLLQLHWLPVGWRIQFKLFTIIHSIFTGKCPTYFRNIVRSVSAMNMRSVLRSSLLADYYSLLSLRTNFSERAFCHVGHTAWNAWPTHTRDVTPDIQLLKTLLACLLTFTNMFFNSSYRLL